MVPNVFEQLKFDCILNSQYDEASTKLFFNLSDVNFVVKRNAAILVDSHACRDGSLGVIYSRKSQEIRNSLW